MKKLLISLLVLFFVIPSCKGAKAQTATPIPDTIKLVFFGDAITKAFTKPTLPEIKCQVWGSIEYAYSNQPSIPRTCMPGEVVTFDSPVEILSIQSPIVFSPDGQKHWSGNSAGAILNVPANAEFSFLIEKSYDQPLLYRVQKSDRPYTMSFYRVTAFHILPYATALAIRDIDVIPYKGGILQGNSKRWELLVCFTQCSVIQNLIDWTNIQYFVTASPEQPGFVNWNQSSPIKIVTDDVCSAMKLADDFASPGKLSSQVVVHGAGSSSGTAWSGASWGGFKLFWDSFKNPEFQTQLLKPPTTLSLDELNKRVPSCIGEAIQ